MKYANVAPITATNRVATPITVNSSVLVFLNYLSYCPPSINFYCVISVIAMCPLN
ncbi:MAG: hypothetical protein L6V78_02155 [Clostridium sp.]|nr:MAG: hypothetical protein L6V78_02155 [Clostridium sp.]